MTVSKKFMAVNQLKSWFCDEQVLIFFFRDSYAFCTEPVFASLANALGRSDNVTPLPARLGELELLDIEIRYGLFRVN